MPPVASTASSRTGRVAGSSPSSPLKIASDALEVRVVAEHADDVQPRAQRELRVAAGQRRRLLGLQPHDDLAVLVEHVDRQQAAAHAHQRRQRAHLDDRREPFAQRAGGQLVEQQAPRAAPDVGVRQLGERRRVDQHRATAGDGERQARRRAGGRRRCPRTCGRACARAASRSRRARPVGPRRADALRPAGSSSWVRSDVHAPQSASAPRTRHGQQRGRAASTRARSTPPGPAPPGPSAAACVPTAA